MTIRQVLAKHWYPSNPYVRVSSMIGKFREVTCIHLPELEADLRKTAFFSKFPKSLVKDRCDNADHNDYGKDILIFTVSEDDIPDLDEREASKN